MKRTVLCAILLGLVLVCSWPGLFAQPELAPSPLEKRLRDEALSRANVLESEPFDASTIDFTKDPNAGQIDPHLTVCRFLPTEPTGTTPKFECKLESGEKIKVKYGWTREIPAETAATRLLDGLGFPADHMSRVDVVRCFGCVVSPFHVRSVARMVHLDRPFDRHLNYDHAIDFVNVGVERKLEGDGIEAGSEKGWGFYELSKVDPARGGASRAEVDALRLMAIFLSHWDNKASNQRLLCPPSLADEDPAHASARQARAGQVCEHPFALMQDMGSDFGPYKLSLDGWRKTPIWADQAACLVSMQNLPYKGATFQDVRISEDGRRLLADRLKPLSRAQIEALFQTAGFEDVDQWTVAFQDRVRQIVDRPACPGGETG